MVVIDGCTILGRDREVDLLPEELLEETDAQEVDRAVVLPLDRVCAVQNRDGNEWILATCRRFPGRLIPTCTANAWFGRSACEEVGRAAKAGARLLVLHPAVQGFVLSDELVYPLCELAAALRLPIYVHTGCPQHATPFQLAELALRFPKVAFIMGHCGATDFWPDVRPAAALSANVYLESSLARPSIFVAHLQKIGFHRAMALR
jgi:hypothetical protein